VSLGSIGTFMDALVTLENTIDAANLRVDRWRPTRIEPPHLYNWIVPSPADIPAVGIVHDQFNVAVRIIVPTGEVDEITSSIESYWDLARDVIDADLIKPAHSTLSTAAHLCRRTSMRNIVDTFNQIDYLGLELSLQADLRRLFT
jgi:hypothetical protein